MKNKQSFWLPAFLCLCILWTGAVQLLTAQTLDKDILLLRQKVIKQAMDRPVTNEEVERLINDFRPDSTFNGINYADCSREGFEHRRHLFNLEYLSLAYRKKGSEYKGNKKVKQLIDQGLAYWVKHDFQSENWYLNEITTPTSLSRILLIMDEALTPGQVKDILPIAYRANMNASGARPSGDRIKIAGIRAQVALFEKDEPTVRELIRIIEGEIKFSAGRGMKQDYSFHHRPDKVNNTVHYGLNYATTFAEWADLVAGTSFRFSDESVNQLIDFYLDGICKQLVYGLGRDMGVLNRDISRRGETDVQSTLIPRQLSNISAHRKDELVNIIRAREGKPFEKYAFAWHYWLSDHFVFQSPHYYSSVRMYSNRIANMEEPYNGEGFYNHFRGDGANHISVNATEYKDIAPFFDWRKVPGTTTLNREAMPLEADLQKQGLTGFTGAVTDGIYGAAAFDFISPHEPLRAKKAWFFFEDAYLCLGTGIRTSLYDVDASTTLNQCLLNGKVVVGSGNKSDILEENSVKEGSVHWVLHDNIGYYFPEPTPVVVTNKLVTGSYSDVSRQASASKEREEKGIFKLWINHQKPVRDAGYCYVVVPGADEQVLEKRSREEPLAVVSNTGSLQAVYSPVNDLLYGVFYKGGILQVAGKPRVEVDHQGMVLVMYEGGKIKQITVSDPTCRLIRFHLAVSCPVTRAGKDYTVVWDEVQQKSHFTIELPQGEFAGKSVTIDL